MKLSQYIEVLQDVVKYEGDGYIWSMEASFPCPREVKLELTPELSNTNFGYSGGKADTGKNLEIELEYEGGVDVLDRSIGEAWE